MSLKLRTKSTKMLKIFLVWRRDTQRLLPHFCDPFSRVKMEKKNLIVGVSSRYSQTSSKARKMSSSEVVRVPTPSIGKAQFGNQRRGDETPYP